MAKSEINIIGASRDEDLHLIKGEVLVDAEILIGDDAISEGYDRFKQLVSDNAGSLLQASVKRDFEDNLTVEIFVSNPSVK